jgi:peptidoglycan hydrolase CwlO-like protein
MPPVKHSASQTGEADNDDTAELPVLDIDAYEATMSMEPLSHSDTWAIPKSAAEVLSAKVTGLTTDDTDVRAKMPAQADPAIPTLRPATEEEITGEYESPELTHPLPKAPRATREAKAASVQKPVARSRDAAPAPIPAPAAIAAPVPAAAVVQAPPQVVAPQTIYIEAPVSEELRAALASAERRIEELQERARIGDIERGVAIARAGAEVAQLREALASHLEAIQTANGRLGVQNSDIPELEDRVSRREARIAALEKELAAQKAAIQEKTAQIAALDQRRLALEGDQAALRVTIARRDDRIATLEADLVARQERESELNTRLTAQVAQAPLATAGDPDLIEDLRHELAAREEQIRTLNLELQAALTKLRDRDTDLHVAEESLRRFEADLRDKSARIDDLNSTTEEWRVLIAESQRSILQRDKRIEQLESDLARKPAKIEAREAREPREARVDPLAVTGEEIALEGPARVLVRTEGNTEHVHVLARRTRIGRGSDNELVLDTKHVSRYHCVLLAGPVHTSIEDLNSTNGVFVNNKRIARHILKDGDRVTVGRTQFRYTVRD